MKKTESLGIFYSCGYCQAKFETKEERAEHWKDCFYYPNQKENKVEELKTQIQVEPKTEPSIKDLEAAIIDVIKWNADLNTRVERLEGFVTRIAGALAERKDE